ncbi:MAG: UDP-3-O-(3-hydroxymyristoyl)glucosamine N-acyltransferase [Bacteroidetes bacterium]|jgi:UDP-3-O-[3-hydroxymyristoyl] glucosamine N-acyltransferase|nr:UDP-3-O-(3-hydroxymyristoyl)glucosamine N-acyltransferase [Bacteroidota bacterium]
MKFTAQQIADLLKGTVEGNPQIEVSGLSKIEEGKPGTLSFLANPKYEPYIYTTQASIVIVNKSFEAEKAVAATLVKVEDAYKSFASLLEIYNQIVNDKKGIEQPSYIDPSATVGKDVYIGAFAYIGKNSVIGNGVKIYPHCYVGDNVVIKDNTTLFAGCRIYSFCQIGEECNIHAGVIIGADGFGFAPNEQNNYKKVPQIGNVIIEDHVEVGAGTTIDRATLGSTIIRKGVKLDNLIQIAHNVEIGENTVIAAQTGVAGSTKIGKNCMIGGQVGIVGHLNIADGVKIAAQSGIGTSITTPGEIVQGSPAFNISDYKRTYVVFKKLPQLERKVNELEKNAG